MTTLLIFAGLLGLSLLYMAVFVWLGAKWVKAGKPSFVRALTVAIIVTIYSLPLGPLTWLAESVQSVDLALALPLALFLGHAIVFSLIVMVVMQTTLARAAITWLVSLVSSVCVMLFVLFVFRPYLVEAFLMPTNGMAPALYGYRKEVECPHCGATMFVTAPGPDEEPRPPSRDFPLSGVCIACSQQSDHPGDLGATLPPDRFIVNKLLEPMRWDIVVFEAPEDRAVNYAKRLVGMPGEKVYIKDGAVWINDVRLEPPEEIADVRYVNEFGWLGQGELMGTPDRPWQLAQDEYVALGDFTQASKDSRFWGPLPKRNLIGVVTVRYWPPSRWKVWR